MNQVFKDLLKKADEEIELAQQKKRQTILAYIKANYALAIGDTIFVKDMKCKINGFEVKDGKAVIRYNRLKYNGQLEGVTYVTPLKEGIEKLS